MINQQVFGSTYSSFYDTLYETKPYEAECNFIEELFNRNSVHPKTILDLGCGTGGHLIPLLKRGYEVTGVDLSGFMLAGAQKKLNDNKLTAELIQGDISSIALNRRFDAVICMFAVIGYLTSNIQVANFFSVLKNHLNPNGFAIFDAWHGAAVLSQKPLQRAKSIMQGNAQVIRITDPVLDVAAHTVDTKFDITVIENDRVISREKESHLVRYFFSQELAYYCSQAGLEPLMFCPFMKPDAILTENDWYVTTVCKPV